MYKDLKKLNAAIKSIKRRSSKLDPDIHNAAVSCIYHMQQCGDVGPTQRLFEALPKSSRVKALMVWFEAFAPVSVNRADGVVRIKNGHKAEDYLVEAAEAQPFWDFSVEREPKPITVDSIRSYLTRLAEGTGKTPIDDDARAMARELLTQFRAQTVAA